MELKPKKFAILIDADNSSVNSIESVLEEVAKYGIASVNASMVTGAAKA